MVVGQQTLDLVVERIGLGEVHEPDRSPRDLVLVGRADAAFGRADLRPAAPPTLAGRRVAGTAPIGEDIGQLLDELDGGDRQTVVDWLDDVDAAVPAVLEVATLAFVLGVTERVFEDEVADLKLRLADFAPELDTRSRKAKAGIDLRFQQLRKQRADHKLLTVTQVPVARSSGSIAVRHVVFRVPEYRRYVIAELWEQPRPGVLVGHAPLARRHRRDRSVRLAAPRRLDEQRGDRPRAARPGGAGRGHRLLPPAVDGGRGQRWRVRWPSTSSGR